MELLETVGLPNKANSYPAQLSGGQQQRVAIARALATEPNVLLCDEATSALDPKTTHAILELIRDINRKMGITVIVITHQMSVVQEICNKVAILENGEVVEEGEVSEVFSNPRTNATRNLIYPEMTEGIEMFSRGGQHLRVIFNGAVTEPLIAKMAMECGIAASIIGASTRSVGDRAYGYMLLDIPGTPEDLARAITYISAVPDVKVQVEAEYNAEEADV
jgi:D-methionine transport system ATP-binding protein